MAHLLAPYRLSLTFADCKLRLSPPSAASKHRVTAISKGRRMSRNLRYPRRTKLPPDPGVVRAPLKADDPIATEQFLQSDQENRDQDRGDDNCMTNKEDLVWTPEEIKAISSLFDTGPPKIRGKRSIDRPLPIPKSNISSLPRFPNPKNHIRVATRAALMHRLPLSTRVYKNPDVLVSIAKEIGALPTDVDASRVLQNWIRVLRKGSLSMTIRELGHMGLPDRALQVLCWAQANQPAFFPDDRILASTVEVLARSSKLKVEEQLEKYLCSASRKVIEAMTRGFIKAGNFKLARRVLLYVRKNNLSLDASIHAKLILQVGRDPDKYMLVEALLDELGEREDLDLRPQDCTSVMKICIRLGKFDLAETLFNWYKASGKILTVVMYTTMIHCRYCSGKYREGLELVWEMEASGMLLDIPAYRVVIRLCVALDDLARAARYFSRLKEAGFTPTYDIYRDMIKAYATSGRLAKCRQICKEVEMAGLKLDAGTLTLLSSSMEEVNSSN